MGAAEAPLDPQVKAPDPHATAPAAADRPGTRLSARVLVEVALRSIVVVVIGLMALDALQKAIAGG